MANTCNDYTSLCTSSYCFRWYSPSLIIPSLTTISDISKQLGHAPPALLPTNVYLRQRCLMEEFLRHHFPRCYNPWGHEYYGNKQLHEYRGGDLERAQYDISRTCSRNLAPRATAIQFSCSRKWHLDGRNRGDCDWVMCAVGVGCDIVCRPASEEGGGTSHAGVRGSGSGALCSRAGRARDRDCAGEAGTGEGGINVRNIALSLVSSCSLNLNPCIRFEISESPVLMPLVWAWRPNIISVASLISSSHRPSFTI